MRPRAVGGLEPDEADQSELVELWHLSRVALAGMSLPHQHWSTMYAGSERHWRIDWVISKFLEAHPGVARKWVYVWCEAQLGRLTSGDPVEVVGPSDDPSVAPARQGRVNRRSRRRR